MCRRFIEKVATECGAKGTNLKSQLVDLARKRVLSGAALVWMERGRQFGNLGAHSEWLDSGDDQNMAIVLLALALAQAVYLEAPKETETDYGSWTASWEKG